MSQVLVVNGQKIPMLAPIASNVKYDNTKSGLEAQTVQSAIDTLSNNMGPVRYRTNDDGELEISKDGGKTWENFSTGGGKAELLWTNPSPNEAFAPQTIDESSAGWVSGKSLKDYDYLLIKVDGSYAWHTYTYNLVSVDSNEVCIGGHYNDNTLNTSMGRRVTPTKNGVIFGDGIYGATVGSVYAIPTEILGCTSEADIPATESGDLLWTNPNPTQTFEPQTISMDLSTYDYLLIEVRGSVEYAQSTLFMVDKDVINFWLNPNINGIAIAQRGISSISNTGITFLNGTKTAVLDNSYGIPTNIWGCKKKFIVPGERSAELIWVNKDPAKAFAPQTLELDLSEYDSVIIISHRQPNASHVHPTAIVGKLSDGVFNAIGDHGIGGTYAPAHRKVTVVSNGLAFDNGYVGTSGANEYCIPQLIYGCKAMGDVPITISSKVVLNQYWSGSTSDRNYGFYYNSNGEKTLGTAFPVNIDNEYYSKSASSSQYTIKQDMLIVHTKPIGNDDNLEYIFYEKGSVINTGTSGTFLFIAR